MNIITKAIILLLVLMIVSLVTINVALAEEQEPDGYWLVPEISNNFIPRYVPVYYVDDIFHCEGDANDARGCYVNKPAGEYIIIVKSMEFDWAKQGCTVHDHEYFHAMGYKHGMGLLSSTCPNPWNITRDNINMIYDENNNKHKDLTNDMNPVREINPRIVSWYVGDK